MYWTRDYRMYFFLQKKIVIITNGNYVSHVTNIDLGCGYDTLMVRTRGDDIFDRCISQQVFVLRLNNKY